MVAAVLFIALVVTLVLNMPVGIAIGVSSLCAILADGRISSLYIVQQLVTSADSFPLMAIPLFILAGELMGAGGVSKRLLNVCNVFLGRFTGGLATVTIVLCMFFAAVSGSGPATVAAIGSMVIPTMLDKGYSKSFTLALIATAGSIGVIIPPSIPMVIYGVSTSTSISSLFMAGFLPGILIGFSLIVVSYLYCKKQGWKGDERKYTAKEKLAAIWDAKWALLNPIIILGGIMLVLGSLSALGYGPLACVKIIGMQFLDFFDFLTNSVMMPISAFAICILVSKVIGLNKIEEEVLNGEGKFRRKKIFNFMIKYLCPIFATIILLSSIANAFGLITI